MRTRLSRRTAARGLVLLGVLLLLALAGVLALVGAEAWSTALKREREAELLFVGDQYRRAIESYWRATPGAAKTLPKYLSDLLDDRRFPMPVRHLRRPFRDPMNNEADWGLIQGPSGIAGVFSTSTDKPLKRGGFPDRYARFESADTYKDWRFLADGQHDTVTPRTPRPKQDPPSKVIPEERPRP
jgi:type II secretory pathway pseudopilin PulG